MTSSKLQRSRLKNVVYLKANLYLRMLHPLATTGIVPTLLLVILNARIYKGILRLRERKVQRLSLSTNADSNLKSITNGKSFHPRNRHEIHMTYIAILIVVTFILLNTTRVVLGFFEVADIWLIIKCVEAEARYFKSLAFYKADTVARLLMVLNSSVNFLIYCWASSKFKVRSTLGMTNRLTLA